MERKQICSTGMSKQVCPTGPTGHRGVKKRAAHYARSWAGVHRNLGGAAGRRSNVRPPKAPRAQLDDVTGKQLLSPVRRPSLFLCMRFPRSQAQPPGRDATRHGNQTSAPRVRHVLAGQRRRPCRSRTRCAAAALRLRPAALPCFSRSSRQRSAPLRSDPK